MTAKILIVDGDVRFRALVAGLLRSQGHQVIGVGTAEEGHRAMEVEAPELVIVDGLLPDGDGLRWIAELRSRGNETAVILIAAPSRDPLSNRQLVLELKVTTVVYRPIDPIEFAKQVGAELGRLSRGGGSAPLQGMNADFEFGQALEELRANYRVELPERLEELSRALTAAWESSADLEGLNQVRVLAHRLRGTASSYGFLQVGEEAGQIEDLVIEAIAAGGLSEGLWRAASQAMSQAEQGVGASPQSFSPAPYNALARLLVVDDDLNFLALLQEMGRSLLIEVTGASTAMEALKIAQEGALDAVFIDAHLAAGEDAFELGRTLRTLPGKESLPFAIVSVDAGVENRVAAAHSGASIFLSKPLSSQQFDAAVRQLLAQGQQAQPRVLVVDDDPAFGEQVISMLEGEQLSVTALHDVGSMLEALADHPPDLLLLDMEMPGMSGVEACRLVRMTPDWQDIPILFLTAHAALGARLAAFEAGADDYLIKPVVPQEISTRVRLRLERNRLLRERSDRDPLTGLLTRRALFDILPARCAEARRHSRPLSLALLDLDFFKRVNDEHGHLVGDRVLMRLGRLLAARFRAEDLRSRWGGEEFLIAFPGETPKTIKGVLERVLAEFAQMPFYDEHGSTFTCSFSVGVSGAPDDGSSPDSLIQNADRRLYEAKRTGRGKVVAEG